MQDPKAATPEPSTHKILSTEEAALTIRALDLQIKSIDRSIKNWQMDGRTSYVRPAQQEREQYHAIMAKLRA